MEHDGTHGYLVSTYSATPPKGHKELLSTFFQTKKTTRLPFGMQQEKTSKRYKGNAAEMELLAALVGTQLSYFCEATG